MANRGPSRHNAARPICQRTLPSPQFAAPPPTAHTRQGVDSKNGAPCARPPVPALPRKGPRCSLCRASSGEGCPSRPTRANGPSILTDQSRRGSAAGGSRLSSAGNPSARAWHAHRARPLYVESASQCDEAVGSFPRVSARLEARQMWDAPQSIAFQTCDTCKETRRGARGRERDCALMHLQPSMPFLLTNCLALALSLSPDGTWTCVEGGHHGGRWRALSASLDSVLAHLRRREEKGERGRGESQLSTSAQRCAAEGREDTPSWWSRSSGGFRDSGLVGRGAWACHLEEGVLFVTSLVGIRNHVLCRAGVVNCERPREV